MTTQISLFPIPNLVVFPGTAVPLHVFEPRYRTMIADAVRDHLMIGVTHTRKQVSPGKGGNTMEEVLASNQATYQPFDVFSAGYCEVVEIMEDGRIHAIVRAESRYRIESEVQTLPYRIVAATEVLDEPEDDDLETFSLQQAVNDRLIRMLQHKNEQLVEILRSDDWMNQSPAEYSFRLFQILNFDADVMQEILEATRAGERLRMIDSVLRQVGR